MSLEKLTGGKVVMHKKLPFLLIEKPLDEMDAGKMEGHVKRYRPYLNLPNIRRKFPQVDSSRMEELYFFDTETTGLGADATVFCLAYTHVNHHVSTTCLFARDYSEEAAVISYFISQMRPGAVYFSYNGNTFDVPRLVNRARQNGVRVDDADPTQSIADHFGVHHIDLINYTRRELGSQLGGASLKLVEKLVFGNQRTGDIPSDKVPTEYKRFVLGAQNEGRIAAIIRHCMLDTLTLPAVLGKFCES